MPATTPHIPRPLLPRLGRGAWSCAAWAALLVSPLGLSTAAGAAPRQPDVSAWPQDPGVALLLQTVRGGASAADSQDAARALVARAQESAARDALARLLTSPAAEDRPAREFVLRAIAEGGGSDGVSPRLYPAIAQRVSDASAEELPALLAALASFRTRDAAGLLVNHTRPDLDTPVREAAFRALARLSGREDLGRDRGLWLVWWREAESLTEGEWRRRLADVHARRADLAAADRDALVDRLTRTLSRLYLEAPAEERGDLLASMLTDPVSRVRDLGFELAGRELASAGRLSPAVGAAALSLLKDSDPATRTSAAVLVRRLATDEARDPIAEALLRETDAAAAEALARAALRWPDSRLADVALLWASRPGPAREEAMDLVESLARVGVLGTARTERALALIRSLSDTSMIPAACAFLARFGTDADIERLIPLLRSQDAALRLAAARALIQDESALPAILEATGEHRELAQTAADAAIIWRPDAAIYRTLAPLLWGSTQQEPDPALVRLARALPSLDLRQVAQESPRGQKLLLLEILTEPERAIADRAFADRAATIAEGAATLAEMVLEGGDPAEALALLERLRIVESHAEHARVGALRTSAYLALGRLDAAAELQAPLEAWMRGLSLSVGKPHARELAREIARRFEGELTEETRQVLAQLETRIEQPPEPASSPGGG